MDIIIQCSHEDFLHYFECIYHIPCCRKISVRNTLTSCRKSLILTPLLRPMDEEESTDTFPVQFILLPCFCLSFIINYKFTVLEIFWSFSILLEAVAILPQLHMLKRTGQAEALTRYYIISLGTYRAVYVLNWVYRYFTRHLYVILDQD